MTKKKKKPMTICRECGLYQEEYNLACTAKIKQDPVDGRFFRNNCRDINKGNCKYFEKKPKEAPKKKGTTFCVHCKYRKPGASGYPGQYDKCKRTIEKGESPVTGLVLTETTQEYCEIKNRDFNCEDFRPLLTCKREAAREAVREPRKKCWAKRAWKALTCTL
jgi:hypothetical protein